MIHTYRSCCAGKIIIDFALCAAALSNDVDMLRLQLQVKMRRHNQFSVLIISKQIFVLMGCACVLRKSETGIKVDRLNKPASYSDKKHHE
jgi:hypothetical protein